MAKLAHALSHHAELNGQRVAMSDDRSVLSRGELAAWTAGAAADLGAGPETIGICGLNSVEWAVGFLAASIAGKTIVPVPSFFSKEQCAHLIRDAGVSRILMTDMQALDASVLGLPVHILSRRRETTIRPHADEGGLIIYTSGSTGRPKGVRLATGQALWSSQALADASGATSDDKYLSVLPLPMLLELICGIMTPVLVGGTVHYDRAIAQSVAAGTAADIAGAFERERPTTSVLVPQLLALYAGQLAACGKRPPDTLRFVAVGGAPLPTAVAEAAGRLGIPAYGGYGLSECASVVAVNRPDAFRSGSVGLPLPGLRVEIEDGEIIVEGPSVMDGYLHADAAPKRWRTGDMGRLDTDGFLTVHGRIDNLIVTPAGRNINPEWIETMLLGDSRISACTLCQIGDAARLTALLIPSPTGEGWFKTASGDAIASLVADACGAAPDYARPKHTVVVSRAEAAGGNLFTPNGRIRRTAAAELLQAKIDTAQSPQTLEVL